MIRFLLLILCFSPLLSQGAPWGGDGCGCAKKADGLLGQVGGAVGSTTNGLGSLGNNEKCGCRKAKSKRHKDAYSKSLPPIMGQEDLQGYVRRVFASKDETTDDYFTRIFRKYKKERDNDYIRRIDTILTEFPWLICKDNLDYYKLTARYYRYKYRRLCSDKSDDQYYTRILRRRDGEDFNSYVRRMDCVFRAHPKLPVWRNILFDKGSDDWYTYRKGEDCDSIRPSLNVRESLVDIYKRRKSEEDDDYSYFQRICNRRTGEKDKDYIERMSRIQMRFKDLPLWHSIDYLDMIKDYYVLIYSKKENEDSRHYYSRLTYKAKNEKLETYVQRVALLEALFHHLPLWNNEDYLDLTKTYYRAIYSKCAGEDSEEYLRRVTARSRSENVDLYIKRMNVVRWVCKNTDLFYIQKYLKYTKPYYEHFYKKGKETTDVWFERIYKRGFEETDEEYVKRVTMIRLVQGKEAFAVTERNLKYVSEFYQLLYKRRKGETSAVWIKRIKSKETSEDDTTYKTRLTFLSTVYSDCKSAVKDIIGTGKQIILGKPSSKQKCKSEKMKNKSKDSSEEDSGEEVSSEQDDSKNNSSEEDSNEGSSSEEDTSKSKSSESYCKKTDSKRAKSLTETDIKKTYEKKEEEDTNTYFKRITKKTSTTEEYVKTLTAIRKYFSSLELWYDKKYIELTREYYTETYSMKSTESEEDYYERIVTKESYETVEQRSKRVEVVRQLYPNLPLWSDDKYYVKYTKQIYSVVYKRADCEEETDYFKRIVLKTAQETDTVYIGRVTLIWRTFNDLKLWYSENTFAIVKQFYNLKYTKTSGECDDDYIKRITVKEIWETTNEAYVQRICLVYKVTIGSTVWSEEKYYEKYTKEVYSAVYKKADCEDETAYFKRIVLKAAQEMDTVYVGRVTLIQRTYNGLRLWYSETTFAIVKQFYTLKYNKKTGECDDDYIERLTAKECWESTDEIYAQRIHLIHQVTSCYTVWYEEKYYEKYTKTYYSVYYKKGDQEGCDAWLTRVITLLPGESEENAINRVTLVKKTKSVCGCNCWTVENLKKIKSSKVIPTEYLVKIKNTFFKSDQKGSSYEMKSSSSASASKSQSSSETEEKVSIKN